MNGLNGQKVNSRGKERTFGVIMKLAGPNMVEMLMDTAVQYIDTIMVGTLGTAATAAVGCTSTVSWLIGSTISAVGIGFLSYIAKAMGAKDEKRASRASVQAVLTTLILGVLFTVMVLSLSKLVPGWMKADDSISETAAVYFAILHSPVLFRCMKIIFGTLLRASGDAKTPMRVGICMNTLNMVLNFFLIYKTRTVVLCGLAITVPGAGLGVSGAAAASAIAYVFGGIASTVALCRHPVLSPIGKKITPDPEVLKPCLQVAMPNMVQRFCTSLGYVVFSSMINSLGAVPTAAHTIANTVESIFYVPGFGMQVAAATLTGNCIGAKDRERLERITNSIVVIEFTMMLFSAGLLFIFAPEMMSLFSSDMEVIALGARVLRIVAVSEPLYGISVVIEGMLQGAGLTKMPFVFNALSMWGIRIVGTYIFVSRLGMGLVAAWLCMIAHNMALLVLFGIYWGREKNRLIQTQYV